MPDFQGNFWILQAISNEIILAHIPQFENAILDVNYYSLCLFCKVIAEPEGTRKKSR